MAMDDHERDTTDIGPIEEAARALPEGTMLGDRYRVEAVIGSGGMGRVYLVADTHLERVVALKTLRAPSAAAMARFRREVRLASRVTHPNVIRLFDLGTAGGTTFLTMEYVAGSSLRARLADGPLSVWETAEVARQVALGLSAAHASGIVHRDLKPENVLLADEGRVVVADFGVAGEQSDSTSSGIVGTSAYMAPEQANGEPVTPRADMYALGLLLFEMLAGHVPLLAAGPVATAMRRLREEPPLLRSLRPDVPAGLEALVANLLHAVPAARTRGASDVAALLEQWASPLPAHVASSPEPAGQETLVSPAAVEPRLGKHGNRRVWAAAAVALLAAVLATFVYRHRATPRADPGRATIFRIASTADARLPPTLAFLQPHVAAAAYRALATQLPGRIAPPGAADDGAAEVQVALQGALGAFEATLRAAGRSATATGAAPAAALDAAAAALLAQTLPHGATPLPMDRLLAARWGAPDQGALDALRRAELLCARMRPAEAAAILATIERPGFVRPYLVHLYLATELDDVDAADLLARARQAAHTAPPAERALLEGAAGVFATDLRPAQALPEPPPDDVWAGVVRAWMLAIGGRADEGFALAERIAAQPDRAGIGLHLANRMAHYYDRGRRVRTAAALADALPEEPRPWTDLARVREWADDLEGAAAARDRARALGASGDDITDVDAQIAIATFDLDAAVGHGRKLLHSRAANARLAGQLTLYAVEVLQGEFARAAGRADALEEALRAAERLHGAETALDLAADAFSRGDHALVRRMLTVAEDMARGFDHDFWASARIRLATLDLIEGRETPARHQARIREAIAQMQGHGMNTGDDRWLNGNRFLIALTRADCPALVDVAQILLEEGDPIAVIAVAECELEAGRADAALTRLETMFRRISRLLTPTLVVRREILLGRALHALGRRDEARPHLERAVSLWSQVADNRDVAVARQLLAR